MDQHGYRYRHDAYISLYHSFLCSIAETAQYMDIISVVVVYVDFYAAIGGP